MDIKQITKEKKDNMEMEKIKSYAPHLVKLINKLNEDKILSYANGEKFESLFDFQLKEGKNGELYLYDKNEVYNIDYNQDMYFLTAGKENKVIDKVTPQIEEAVKKDFGEYGFIEWEDSVRMIIYKDEYPKEDESEEDDLDESNLVEAEERINLKKYGFVRAPEEDFDDDGNKFSAYYYDPNKTGDKRFRLTKLVDSKNQEAYIEVKYIAPETYKTKYFDDLNGVSINEAIKGLPKLKEDIDEFLGKIDDFNSIKHLSDEEIKGLVEEINSLKERAGLDTYAARKRAFVNKGIVEEAVSREDLRKLDNALRNAAPYDKEKLKEDVKAMIKDVIKEMTSYPGYNYRRDGQLHSAKGIEDAIASCKWHISSYPDEIQQKVINHIASKLKELHDFKVEALEEDISGKIIDRIADEIIADLEKDGLVESLSKTLDDIEEKLEDKKYDHKALVFDQFRSSDLFILVGTAKDIENICSDVYPGYHGLDCTNFNGMYLVTNDDKDIDATKLPGNNLKEVREAVTKEIEEEIEKEKKNSQSFEDEGYYIDSLGGYGYHIKLLSQYLDVPDIVDEVFNSIKDTAGSNPQMIFWKFNKNNFKGFDNVKEFFGDIANEYEDDEYDNEEIEESVTKTLSDSKEEFENEFKFLERLRKSGVTNMFGAAPYLAREFNLDIGAARTILSEWMKRYDELDKKYGWQSEKEDIDEMNEKIDPEKKFTDEELSKFIKELSERFYDQGSYYDIWGYDGTIQVNIDWGDWKHDHQYFKTVTSNFFKEKGIAINIEDEVTEENGSDVYSAIYTITKE